MVDSALFSCDKLDYGTPDDLFNALHKMYSFECDASATAENTKLPVFFSPDENALKQDWSKYKSVWLNPPYGRNIGEWIAKAANESKKGTTVVCCLQD